MIRENESPSNINNEKLYNILCINNIYINITYMSQDLCTLNVLRIVFKFQLYIFEWLLHYSLRRDCDEYAKCIYSYQRLAIHDLLIPTINNS